jgi:hypothetical protein
MGVQGHAGDAQYAEVRQSRSQHQEQGYHLMSLSLNLTCPDRRQQGQCVGADRHSPGHDPEAASRAHAIQAGQAHGWLLRNGVVVCFRLVCECGSYM